MVPPVVQYGGRYKTRTCDPLRVNCAGGLNFIVFEANLGIRACPYFSFKNSFFSDSLETICAKFVPLSHLRLSLTGSIFCLSL